MENNLNLSNDDLEEQGLVECCSHCYSLHITMEGNNLYCNNCGAVGFTEIITETEYQEKVRINC